MTNAIEKHPAHLPSKIEEVLMKGDLKSLSDQERLTYFNRVCESVGLNPLTQPFSYITLNGKLVLYANKSCTDQLRSVHKISIEIVSREKVGDVYVVTARARTPDGRTDESTGAVALGKASGEMLANLYMKAETKAKRRVTLSICGLGLLDESEVDSIPGAQRVPSEPKPVAQIKEANDLIPYATPHTDDTLTELDEQDVVGCDPIIEQLVPGERVIHFGKKHVGKKFKELDKQEIRSFLSWMKTNLKDFTPEAQQFMTDAEEYLDEVETKG